MSVWTSQPTPLCPAQWSALSTRVLCAESALKLVPCGQYTPEVRRHREGAHLAPLSLRNAAPSSFSLSLSSVPFLLLLHAEVPPGSWDQAQGGLEMKLCSGDSQSPTQGGEISGLKEGSAYDLGLLSRVPVDD